MLARWFFLAITVTFGSGCRQDMDEQRDLSTRLSNVTEASTRNEQIRAPSQSPEPRTEAVDPPTPPPADAPQIDISRLHFDSFVIDTHVDTPQTMFDVGFDFLVRNDSGHLDAPRMREGGLDAAVFAIWVDPDEYTGGGAFQRALDLFNSVHELDWRSPHVSVVESVAEIRAADEEGRLGLLFGVEGGHALGTDEPEEAIRRLRTFRALGARYMTITWSKDNPLGYSSTGDHPDRGLTSLGRTIVEEMERLGMVVDVSHVSDQTFWDIMEVVSNPVMASHSNARALADHPRNMTDDMIRRVAEIQGVVCVNYFTYYLDTAYSEERSRIYDENRSAYRDIRRQGLSYTGSGPAYREVALGLEPDLRVPDIATIADHIMHIVEVAGPETVCLGSDFDGVPELPLGMHDVTGLPALSAELSARGLTNQQIGQILGENVLRVLRASELQ